MSTPHDRINSRSGKRNQITLTDETFKEMGVQAGETFHIVRAKSPRGAIILKPERRKKVKPWTEEEWRQKESEADEAIAKGDVSGPFHSGEELIKHLRAASKKWRSKS